MLHLYCPLCGVVLSCLGDGTPWSFPLSWHQEIRALSRTLDDDKPVLSGVGYVVHGAYRANFDPPTPYTDAPTLGTYDLPSGPEPTTYLFHDACWKLLPRRAGAMLDFQGREERIAELLFHLLQCLRKDKNGVPLTPHTFGGISSHRDSYGYTATGYRDSLKDALKYVMADPRLDLEEEIRESLGLFSCRWQTPGSSPIRRETPNTQDPFLRLPSEIIPLIMEELSIGSICHLRRASRAVASITSPPDLPQSFWERRFATPFEMGFFFAGDAPPVSRREIDWRALYARVRGSLAARVPGILNRRRISQCGSIVCAALVPLLLEANSEWPPAVPSVGEDVIPEGCRLGRWVGSQATLRYDAQYLPLCGLRGSSPITVSATFVYFNCQSYISGLKVTSSDSNGRRKTIRDVGIHRPDRMEHVNFGQGSSVSGVRVYTIAGGVVGLEFLSHDASLGTLLIGSRTPPAKYTAVAELRPRDSTVLDGLVVYLDICKCIALQAVEVPTDAALPTANTADFENTTEPPPLPVWKPHAPPPDGEVDLIRSNPFEVYRPRTSPVLLNINFGGPRGEKLRLLNRVVALLDGYHGVFKGLEFFYDDRTSELHGSRRLVEDAGTCRACIEQSFVVCGKQGERVTEIRVDRGRAIRELCVRRLQFRTNMGSEHSFQLLEKYASRNRLTEVATFKPREGHVLTGLVAESMARGRGDILDGTLHAWGMVDAPRHYSAQGAASDNASTEGVSIQRAIEPFGGQRCCWSSAAKLKNVTRIRFSGGMSCQRPRDDKHITGLMFHFRGSERAAIVGQWMSEVDSMDIDDGDRITHVRVYHRPRPGSACLPREYRRACGMVVGTARWRRKVVLARECEEVFYTDYYANPLEEMDGMVWGFSHRADRIQMVNLPSPRAGNRRLRFPTKPGLEEHHRDTHDLRRFLWSEVDSQGNDVRLSAIEAYFTPDHLSGLTFVYYREELRRSVGYCEGELATLCLAPTEKVRAMAGDVHSEKGHVLVFHTNLQEAVFLHHPSTEVRPGDGGHIRYRMDKESVIWTPKSEVEELKTREEVEPPADARECVGIWVRPWVARPPHPCIQEVGPIFLEDLPRTR